MAYEAIGIFNPIPCPTGQVRDASGLRCIPKPTNTFVPTAPTASSSDAGKVGVIVVDHSDRPAGAPPDVLVSTSTGQVLVGQGDAAQLMRDARTVAEAARGGATKEQIEQALKGNGLGAGLFGLKTSTWLMLGIAAVSLVGIVYINKKQKSLTK